MTSGRAVVAVILLSCGLGRVAHATACRPTIASSPALAEIDAERRIAFLSQRLDAAARASRIWTGSWLAVYGVLTVGSFAIVPLVPREARVDYYFSGATSAIGLLSLGLSPLKSIGDARWLRGRSRDNPCALVADGERLLVRDAASEADGRKLLLHLGNIALNFGSLMVLGFVFHRWEAAALQGVAGTLIGELMIMTTPTQATIALEAYRAGRLSGAPSRWPISLAAAPMILQQGGGIAIGGRF